MMYFRALMCLFICLYPPFSSASSAVHLLALPAVLDDLDSYLNGRDIENVTNFSGTLSRRDTVEHVLMYQALLLGGLKKTEIQVSPWKGVSYKRLMSLLQEGYATTFSNTIWREDVYENHSKLYVTSEMLSYKENIAGLYMTPLNPKFNDEINIQNWTAVSSLQWKPDWNALQTIPLQRVYSAVNWESMVKMVHSQRADFMLLPFSTEPDLSFTAIGITLKPKAGVKVILDGSRGWIVSKAHPAGNRTYEALERGIKELHELGRIKKAYTDAGVINSRVEGWKVLNPPIKRMLHAQQ